MLNLLFRIIDATKIGLPLGFYTSQWFANFYMQTVDHFIKEKLGAKHYIRYMDDMVIFGANKKELHRMRDSIAVYLWHELGLKMKENWQVYRFSYVRSDREYGRDLDFMGFRFYRNRTVLRRNIMLKSTRKAKKLSKKDKATIYDIRQMMSYLGWLDYTDTYEMYAERIKPYVNIQYFERRLSRYDKRRLREVENGNQLRAS